MRTVEKLKSRRGESLVESIASMLVIVLALAMLAGAIVSAGKSNQSAENTAAFVNGAAAAGTVTVTVRYDGGSTPYTEEYTADIYRAGADGAGGLYYYEYTKPEP